MCWMLEGREFHCTARKSVLAEGISFNNNSKGDLNSPSTIMNMMHFSDYIYTLKQIM